MLTNKQESFLNLIKNFYLECQDFPSLNDLVNLTNYKSYNTIYKYLTILETKGYLIFDKKRKKITYLKDSFLANDFFHIPFINKKDYLKVDSKLLKNNKTYFAFNITNNSLASLFIKNKDILILEKDNKYLDGKLVLVKIDNQLKVYQYRKKDGFIHLKNDLHSLILKDNQNILGKVVLIIRNCLY